MKKETKQQTIDRLKKEKQEILESLARFICEGPINVDEYIWGDVWKDLFTKHQFIIKNFNDK